MTEESTSESASAGGANNETTGAESASISAGGTSNPQPNQTSRLSDITSKMDTLEIKVGAIPIPPPPALIVIPIVLLVLLVVTVAAISYLQMGGKNNQLPNARLPQLRPLPQPAPFMPSGKPPKDEKPQKPATEEPDAIGQIAQKYPAIAFVIATVFVFTQLAIGLAEDSWDKFKNTWHKKAPTPIPAPTPIRKPTATPTATSTRTPTSTSTPNPTPSSTRPPTPTSASSKTIQSVKKHSAK